MKIFRHKLTGRLGETQFGILLVFFMASVCYADRVCLEKATGKLIEFQSDGNNQEDLNVMIKNAESTGYKKDDVEAKFITKEEWQAIEETQIKAPAREEAKQKSEARKAKEASLKTKFGWTDEDLKALKEIFEK